MPKAGTLAARERARVAAAARWKTGDLPERQRDLRAAKLEDAARAAADALPPLTEDQARRIAAILYPQGVE